MKNTLIFYALLPFTVFFNIYGSQEMTVPLEMLHHIIHCDLTPSHVSALKQTCSELNKTCNYWQIGPDIIKEMDETICTKGICHFAQTEEEQNFLHFFHHNNVETRKDALQLLGWKDCNDTKQLMEAHCKGGYDIINDWNSISNNNIAINIICLSNNPNIQDNHGYTVLMCAFNEHLEVVKLLLAHPNIDINIKNKYGYTALIWASHNRQTELIKLLLAHPNININIQDKEDSTVLMWSCVYGHTDVVKLLLTHSNIDINIQDNDGKTALIWACINGYTEIVKLLLAHPNIDINIQDNNGKTALIWVSLWRRTEVVKLLLAHPNIDINIQDNDGHTALIWAQQRKYQGIEKLIKENQ